MNITRFPLPNAEKTCPAAPEETEAFLSPSLLEDGHGRRVRYVRLSVTDRCNLRCSYCRSGFERFIPHEQVLRYEEMEQLVDLAVDLGVEKVRLTGGEPFARKGFMTLVERLRARHPALDIRVTTNGTLLMPYVRQLADLKVNAVNLSLDTFDRNKYTTITGRDVLPKVEAAMAALLEAGVPLKVNAVAMRGVNDDELDVFLRYGQEHAVDVRFIEFMPMGEDTRWTTQRYWSADHILEAARALTSLKPSQRHSLHAGPARMYDLEGAGRFGVITPLSNHFCGECNRLRVTSDGRLRTCLFDDSEYRLREAMRHPRLGIEAVRRIVIAATKRKPLGVHLLEQRPHGVALKRMTAIGG